MREISWVAEGGLCCMELIGWLHVPLVIFSTPLNSTAEGKDYRITVTENNIIFTASPPPPGTGILNHVYCIPRGREGGGERERERERRLTALNRDGTVMTCKYSTFCASSENAFHLLSTNCGTFQKMRLYVRVIDWSGPVHWPSISN